MKQRRNASIIMAASLLLLAGCQKDEVAPAGQGRLMLNLESFGNGSTKTVLGADDRSLQWLTGDQVCINGTDYAVTASGESAYVAGVPDATVYKAVFPASMVAGRSMSGNTVTATLPAACSPSSAAASTSTRSAAAGATTAATVSSPTTLPRAWSHTARVADGATTATTVSSK